MLNYGKYFEHCKYQVPLEVESLNPMYTGCSLYMFKKSLYSYVKNFKILLCKNSITENVRCDVGVIYSRSEMKRNKVKKKWGKI